jgi:hypothetical protein
VGRRTVLWGPHALLDPADVLGVTPPFVKNCTLRSKADWNRLAPKRSQLANSKASVAAPMIISGEVDVFPRQRREMRKQLLVNDTAAFSQRAVVQENARAGSGRAWHNFRYRQDVNSPRRRPSVRRIASSETRIAGGNFGREIKGEISPRIKRSSLRFRCNDYCI